MGKLGHCILDMLSVRCQLRRKYWLRWMLDSGFGARAEPEI